MSQDAINNLANWGRQSIIWPMQLRAVADKKPINRADSEPTFEAAERVLESLWDEATEACGEQFEPGSHAMEFAKRVFSWCSEHRFGG